jgi:hypothetical protein
MTTKPMSAEESIGIIQSIIETEKMRFSENGFIYRMWGWLVIFAASLEYLLFYMNVQHHYYAWFLMILGGVYTGIYYSKSKNRQTYPLSGKIMAYTWIAASLNIFIVSFFFPQMAGQWLLFIILAFIGVATVVSGALLRFPLMIIGGFICNALAFASLFTSPAYWGLYSIMAVTVSDLIPGYVLKAKFSEKNV